MAGVDAPNSFVFHGRTPVAFQGMVMVFTGMETGSVDLVFQGMNHLFSGCLNKSSAKKKM